MAWIADGGWTFVGEGARVARSVRSTGLFRLLESVAGIKTVSLRPTVERFRVASVFTKLWDKKLLSEKGMSVLKELVRISFLLYFYKSFFLIENKILHTLIIVSNVNFENLKV